MTAISIRGLTKNYGRVKALKGIDLDLHPGELVALIGPNGAGKSTLIKTVSGVHKPEPGAVMEWDGRDMSDLDPAKAREMGIQVIWQDLALFPEMSVAENIAFERNLGGKPRLVNHKAMRSEAAAILERLGVSIDLEAKVSSLSIANRQLVAVARALIADARLVFMDEPTASLSQHTFPP